MSKKMYAVTADIGLLITFVYASSKKSAIKKAIKSGFIFAAKAAKVNWTVEIESESLFYTKEMKMAATILNPERGFEYFTIDSFDKLDLDLVVQMIPPGTEISLSKKTFKAHPFAIDCVFRKNGKVEIVKSMYMENKVYKSFSKLVKALKSA